MVWTSFIPMGGLLELVKVTLHSKGESGGLSEQEFCSLTDWYFIVFSMKTQSLNSPTLVIMDEYKKESGD